ncbi:MAG: ATP-binding protein [Acidimicrobiales bacterium]
MTLGPEEHPVAALFAEVVGQPRAVQALRAAARDPVHAYLFCGAEGSGTRAAARAFAAALLCPEGGCGHCATCHRALAGTHPDLVTVERTGASLGVDEARRLVGLAQRRPFEASRQVLVVTDLHLAVRSAPALLKTIEEPPASTVFVLLADAIPPELVTVASRCVEVEFPPVPTGTIARWLEDRGVPAPQAALVAEGAAGDLGRAALVAEDPDFAERLALWRSVPAVLDGHGATAGRLARQLLGAADAALVPLKAHHAAELEAMAEEAKELGERGVPGRKEVVDRQHREERRWRTDELRIGLGVLARAYRDRLAEALSAPAPAPGSPGRGFAAAVDLITTVAASLEHNPNETLLLESLLVRLGSLAA